MDLRTIQYQKNSEILKKYLPGQSVALIAVWIVDFDFKLKIKKERLGALYVETFMTALNLLKHA